jgi:hypothetical protein
MKKFSAGCVGFLTAPLVSALLSVVTTPSARTISVVSTLGFLALFYVISAAVMAVFAIPAFFLLLHFRFVNWWTTVVAGFGIGIIVGVVITLPNSTHPHDLMTPGIIGGAAAFSFWLIWRKGVPSKDVPLSD